MQSAPVNNSLHFILGTAGIVLLAVKMAILSNSQIEATASRPLEITIPNGQTLPQSSLRAEAPKKEPEAINPERALDVKMLCHRALNLNKDGWDAGTMFADEVKEATRRGLSIADCRGHIDLPRETKQAFQSYTARICNPKYPITNIRDAPGTKDTRIILTASNSTLITVIGETYSPTSGHKWLNIIMRSSGENGYVDHELVTTANCTPPVQSRQDSANDAVKVRFATDGQGAVTIRIMQGPSNAVRVRNAKPGEPAVTVRLAREGEPAVNVWFVTP